MPGSLKNCYKEFGRDRFLTPGTTHNHRDDVCLFLSVYTGGIHTENLFNWELSSPDRHNTMQVRAAQRKRYSYLLGSERYTDQFAQDDYGWRI